MTKFDKIREKKKTAKRIKDAKKHGEIKENQTKIHRINFEEPKWFTDDTPDIGATKWITDGVVDTGVGKWFTDDTPDIGATKWITDGVVDTGVGKWFTDDTENHKEMEVGNNNLIDWWKVDEVTDTQEKKIEQIHEDMAELRKYTKELETQLIALRGIVTSTMHEKNRLKKQIKDQREEMQTFLQKNGELFRFMKEKMLDVKRERMQRTTEFKIEE